MARGRPQAEKQAEQAEHNERRCEREIAQNTAKFDTLKAQMVELERRRTAAEAMANAQARYTQTKGSRSLPVSSSQH